MGVFRQYGFSRSGHDVVAAREELLEKSHRVCAAGEHQLLPLSVLDRGPLSQEFGHVLDTRVGFLRKLQRRRDYRRADPDVPSVFELAGYLDYFAWILLAV